MSSADDQDGPGTVIVWEDDQSQMSLSFENAEDAKVIFNRLKNIEQILLADFKSEFDLSNKKWDKVLKELRGNDLIDIFKSDDGSLFIKPI